MPLPTLLVHGGAGIYGDETLPEAIAGVHTAAAAGFSVLREGGSAVEAVVAAVRTLEDDPRFNAGLGSTLNADGTVENDAAVMSGEDLSGGAVAVLSGFRNPILIADAVRRDGQCVLIAGEGARRFALARGFEAIDPNELVTAAQRARWQEERVRREADRRRQAVPGEKLGTVGAVACDSRGHVAAATSTGGLIFKIPGRVGDTPILGAGTYADDLAGAASCTGHGEAILKIGMAKAAVDHLRGGATAQEAARLVVHTLGERAKALGGIIVVSPRGDLGVAFNTERMSRAYFDESLAAPIAAIERD
jgi:L-asparaginase / beta-aspartyl-peptidase